ncbi:MAG TPA: TonB family protein [Thermoanaerobaculia bacterium]|nr:TonB family protein [Thermoanaerobaculia bacterium]
MTVPELPNKRGTRAPSRREVGTPGRLPPVVLVLGAAAVVVVIVGGLVLAMLLFRRSASGTQEVVGSALPPVWQPGGDRGVGQVPPEPPGGRAAAPVGSVPPVQEAEPLAPPAPAPEEGQLPPFEGAPTPAYGEPAPPPAPEPVAAFEPPRLVDLPTPEYPRLGLRMRREGVVELQVLVSANGRVLSAEPVGERLGLGFENAARRAAFNARFEPARRDGEPVEGEARIAIRFRLQ